MADEECRPTGAIAQRVSSLLVSFLLVSCMLEDEVKIQATWLGQSGLRIEYAGTVCYFDPYLSDSVEAEHGPLYRRQVAPPMRPDAVIDADFVFITHGHIDHCDPETLPALAQASPDCRFLAPSELRKTLVGFGIAEDRILDPIEKWIPLASRVRVHPVPAAHPEIERDAQGALRCLGFVLDCGGRRVYHAGDTSPDQKLIDALRALAPIHVAVLPVNEFNFFRSQMGIVGNMSVREAFALAAEIGAELLTPVHWDMFAPNSVYPEEVELLFDKLAPPFDLRFQPEEL